MTDQIPRARRLPPEIRRRELLDAALDLIVEEGFDAVTVEAVARRAGVTRPVVYDFFGDLDGLLLVLIDRAEDAALGPLLEIVGGDPGDGVEPEQFLVDGVRAFLEAVRADPRTWRLVLMPPRGSTPELRERITRQRRMIADRVHALIDWGVAKRGGPAGLDHALAARLIVAAGEDAARLTLLHPKRYPPERVAAIPRAGLALLPPGGGPTGGPRPAGFAIEPPRAPAVPAPAAPKRMPRAERREHLLDAALDLIADQGWDALSMEAIARRADVNRAIVYRSFANLQLLLVALLRREDTRTRAMLDALLPDDPGDRTTAQLLGEALAAFLGAVAANPQTYRVILQRPESAPLFLQKLVSRRRVALAGRLRPLIEWGLAGIAAPATDLDVDLVARMLLSSAEEIARLLLDDPDYPPERLLESAWALLDSVPAA